MTRRTVLALAVSLLALLGCRGPEPLSGLPDELVVSAGTEGGIYDAYGEALAATLEERAGTDVTVLRTDGSLENLQQLASGRSDIAFSTVDAAADAIKGRGDFKEPLPLRAVARIYDDVVHLVVAASSDIENIRDLEGRRLSIGATGSGTSLIARRLLMAAKLETEDVRVRSLSLADSVEALRSGTIDAFFWSGGLRTPALVDLAADTAFRLVPLSHLGRNLRANHGEVYRYTIVAQDNYGLNAQVETLAVPNVLLVRDSMSDGEAEALLETLFDARDAIESRVPSAALLDQTKAIFTSPVDLHPGVLRYYRDTKE